MVQRRHGPRLPVEAGAGCRRRARRRRAASSARLPAAAGCRAPGRPLPSRPRPAGPALHRDRFVRRLPGALRKRILGYTSPRHGNLAAAARRRRGPGRLRPGCGPHPDRGRPPPGAGGRPRPGEAGAGDLARSHVAVRARTPDRRGGGAGARSRVAGSRDQRARAPRRPRTTSSASCARRRPMRCSWSATSRTWAPCWAASSPAGRARDPDEEGRGRARELGRVGFRRAARAAAREAALEAGRIGVFRRGDC